MITSADEYLSALFKIYENGNIPSLATLLHDTERIYNYKLLLKFFENCIDKVNPSFLKKYCAQICKE